MQTTFLLREAISNLSCFENWIPAHIQDKCVFACQFLSPILILHAKAPSAPLGAPLHAHVPPTPAKTGLRSFRSLGSPFMGRTQTDNSANVCKDRARTGQGSTRHQGVPAEAAGGCHLVRGNYLHSVCDLGLEHPTGLHCFIE